jgi:hypothetical protein
MINFIEKKEEKGLQTALVLDNIVDKILIFFLTHLKFLLISKITLVLYEINDRKNTT